MTAYDPAVRSSSASPARQQSERSELDFRAFLSILRRRLWVVLFVPVLVGGTAFAYANTKTPRYRASVDILLGQTQAEALFNPLRTSSSPDRLLANQIRVLRSNDVTTLVRGRLGFVPAIDASASKTEDVISLSAADTDRKRAADLVNAYADSYLDYRRSSGASENAAAQEEIQNQIDAARMQVGSLDQQLDLLPADQRDQARTAQAAVRLPLEDQLTRLQSQLTQLQAAAKVDRGGAQLLARAQPPSVAFEPNPRRSLVLGLAIGVVLGIGLALALDYVDSRIRGKEDLERITGAIPVVGLIPAYSVPHDKPNFVISLEKPASGVAEAYRSLRTATQFLGLDRSMRVILVTSPAASEGKTTTLVNLAVALAAGGQRVVVVDCDLRRPRVHEYFGLDRSRGLTSVLLGQIELGAALTPVPAVPRLFVLPSGPAPPNPSELLLSKRTMQIVETLMGNADVILVDSPPVLPVADATILSSRVDATLLIVDDGRTHRKQLAFALERLRQVEAVVVGTVLNRVSGRAYQEYGYTSNYSYRTRPETAAGENGDGAKSAPAAARRKS